MPRGWLPTSTISTLLTRYGVSNTTYASTDNPFLAMQQQFSKTMVDALNLYRDLREELVERSFQAVYGSPLVQAACGISANDSPPRPRPGMLPFVLAAAE